MKENCLDLFIDNVFNTFNLKFLARGLTNIYITYHFCVKLCDSVLKIDLPYSFSGSLWSLASYMPKVFSLERLSAKILSFC